MNLHAIVSGAIGTVNPFVPITVRISNGYTTAPGGKRTPIYKKPLFIQGQIQALQAEEIRHLDSLNIQGEKRKIYISGRIDGLVRVDGKGGDLITTPDGKVWLVVLVIEYWPDWCSVAVSLQDGS